MGIRWYYGCLILTMEFPILVQCHLYIELATRGLRVDPNKYAHGLGLLCFIVVRYGLILSTSFLVTSLALDRPNGTKATMHNVGIMYWHCMNWSDNITTTKQKTAIPVYMTCSKHCKVNLHMIMFEGNLNNCHANDVCYYHFHVYTWSYIYGLVMSFNSLIFKNF